MNPKYYSLATIILPLLIMVNACEKHNSNTYKITFEHYAINYAWGFQYVHWIIDNDGNVRIHHKPDSIIWLNEDNLDEKITSFDSVIYTIDSEEFNTFLALIPSAAQENKSCIEQHRADFGTTVFNAICRDKIILLSSMSDIEDCINNNSSAIQIENWLKTIHATIYSKK
jgi:hypothetical protein